MIFIVIAFFIFLGVSYGFFIEPKILDIERVLIKVDPNKTGLNNKRLVLLSDLHFNKKTKNYWLEKILKNVRKLSPDIIFIAGDLVGDIAGTVPSIRFVQETVKICPVYIVFGNWEYNILRKKLGEFRIDLEKTGADVLIDEERNINYGGYKLNIIGTEDPYTTKKTSINIDRNIKPKENSVYEVLLSHSPDIVPDAIKTEVDLVLAGHTHGGQVYIPFLTPFMIPVRPEAREYGAGYFKKGKTSIYVSRGIGQSTLPIRFLTPPEITLLVLRNDLQ